MSGSSGAQFGRAAYRAGLVSRGQVIRWGDRSPPVPAPRRDRRRTPTRSSRPSTTCCAACRRGRCGGCCPTCSRGSCRGSIRRCSPRSAAHQDAGRPAFIVSAASNGVVEVLARVLDMEGGIGTRYEVDDDGLYTGRLIGGLNYGELKVEPMRRFAADHGIDLDESWAYSDSVSDLPMLELVGHPIVVNPDAPLARIAAERGWPVMRFEKLGRTMRGGGVLAVATWSAAAASSPGVARPSRAAARRVADRARERIGSRPMDASELAFAGIHRQAELLRDGDVSSRDLVSIYLERIEPLRRPAERLPGRARRARPRRGRRRPIGGSRRGRPRRCSASRSPSRTSVDVAGELTTHGTGAFDRPRRSGLGPLPAPARGGRRARRQDEPARARDLAVHRERRRGGGRGTPGIPGAAPAAPAAAPAPPSPPA